MKTRAMRHAYSMPIKLYKIRNWQEHFENCETRKLKTLQWWPKPNKHDGLGFRKMVAQRNRIELYCAWNLICDLASKTTPKERRGYMERENLPMSPEDMGFCTGFPGDVFQRALDFFSSPSVGWLCVEELDRSPDVSGEFPDVSGFDPAEGKGREGKEGNRILLSAAASACEGHQHFLPVSAEDIYQAYPRKVGKPVALKAITKQMGQHCPNCLLEQTVAFARARDGEDEQYTPHPATWFNQQRFNDDPATWKRSVGQVGAAPSGIDKQLRRDELQAAEAKLAAINANYSGLQEPSAEDRRQKVVLLNRIAVLKKELGIQI